MARGRLTSGAEGVVASAVLQGLESSLGGCAGIGVPGSSCGQQVVQQRLDRQAGPRCGTAGEGLPLLGGDLFPVVRTVRVW